MRLKLQILPLLMASVILFACSKQTIAEKELLKQVKSTANFPECDITSKCQPSQMVKAGKEEIAFPMYNVGRDNNWLPNYLDITLGLTQKQYLYLKPVYIGDSLVLLSRENADTIMTAILDPCGRVIASDYNDPLDDRYPRKFYYEYNLKGKLINIRYAPDDTPAYTLAYDNLGNVLSIASLTGLGTLEYTYDTSYKVSGRSMYYEGRTYDLSALTIMQVLGHVDLNPVSLRVGSKTYYAGNLAREWQYSNHYFFRGNLDYYVETVNRANNSVWTFQACPTNIGASNN